MIPLRPKFRWLRILCVAIAMVAGVDAVARDLGTLSLNIREADSNHPRVMLLAGSWPDRCVPQFLKSTRDRSELTLQLHAPSDDCVAESTPFQLPIEVRTAFGTSAPERQIYRVRITLSHGDQAEQLIGFRLLDLGAMPVQPESGFWWSRSRPGDTAPALAGGGIGLEVQGNQLAVSLLAFAADGTPTWYFGSADMNGRIAQVPLIRLINGGGSNTLNGRPAGIEPGPLLALDFAGPTEARAWLLGPLSSTPDAPLRLQPLLLHRAIFDARVTGSSWLGSWVLVQGDQARLLRMGRIVTEDGESFRLLGDDDKTTPTSLNCRYRGSGSGAEVEGCSLIESGRVTASFGQVGIDRLSGNSADGRSAQLLRLQP